MSAMKFAVLHTPRTKHRLNRNLTFQDNQGPVVQSVVSLTSSLVVKILTVLVNTISNSQVFLLKKM